MRPGRIALTALLAVLTGDAAALEALRRDGRANGVATLDDLLQRGRRQRLLEPTTARTPRPAFRC